MPPKETFRCPALLVLTTAALLLLLLLRAAQPARAPVRTAATQQPGATAIREWASLASSAATVGPGGRGLLQRPVRATGERGGYTFFSTDYHIAPIADLADVFASLCDEAGLCMRVEEHSFSGACGRAFGGRKPTCARGLRVLTKENAFDFCPRPHALRRAFFDANRGPDSPLAAVDAFVCNHPPALCEAYMPFNKSLLVVATVNLEFSRENEERWAEWLRSLRAIAANRRNVVAANNPYDAAYIRHFAGIEAEYIPSYCGYAARSAGPYSPQLHKPLLIARNHNNPAVLIRELQAAARREGGGAPRGGRGRRRGRGRGARREAAGGWRRAEATGGGAGGPAGGGAGGGAGELGRRGGPLSFARTEDAYPRGFEHSLSSPARPQTCGGVSRRPGWLHRYSDLARHPAVVLLPYTKSVMSFFELYRMNVPMFAPSLELLVQWERRHSLLKERIYWTAAPQPLRLANGTPLSPNTRDDPAALRHWLALCDFYHFPHITYFDSWPDLLAKLRSADLAATSAAMRAANRRLLDELRQQWRRLFLRMFRGAPPGSRAVPSDYDAAMRALYGQVPPSREPSCRRESRPEYGEWG